MCHIFRDILRGSWRQIRNENGKKRGRRKQSDPSVLPRDVSYILAMSLKVHSCFNGAKGEAGRKRDDPDSWTRVGKHGFFSHGKIPTGLKSMRSVLGHSPSSCLLKFAAVLRKHSRKVEWTSFMARYWMLFTDQSM